MNPTSRKHARDATAIREYSHRDPSHRASPQARDIGPRPDSHAGTTTETPSDTATRSKIIPAILILVLGVIIGGVIATKSQHINLWLSSILSANTDESDNFHTIQPTHANNENNNPQEATPEHTVAVQETTPDRAASQLTAVTSPTPSIITDGNTKTTHTPATLDQVCELAEKTGPEISNAVADDPPTQWDRDLYAKLSDRHDVHYGVYNGLRDPEEVARILQPYTSFGTYSYSTTLDHLPEAKDQKLIQASGKGMGRIHGDYSMDLNWRFTDSEFKRAIRELFTEIDPNNWRRELELAAQWSLMYHSSHAPILAELAILLSRPNERPARAALLAASYAANGRLDEAQSVFNDPDFRIAITPENRRFITEHISEKGLTSLRVQDSTKDIINLFIGARAPQRSESNGKKKAKETPDTILLDGIWINTDPEQKKLMLNLLDAIGTLTTHSSETIKTNLRGMPTSDLVALTNRAYQAFGRASPIVVDLLLTLNELHGYSERIIRGPEMVYSCIQMYRLHGLRSFPAWMWLLKQCMLSPSEGGALYHDYFNAMEAGLYASNKMKDGPTTGLPKDVQMVLYESLVRMLTISRVVSIDPACYEKFRPTWGHRLLPEDFLIRTHMTFGGRLYGHFLKAQPVIEEILRRHRIYKPHRLEVIWHYGRTWLTAHNDNDHLLKAQKCFSEALRQSEKDDDYTSVKVATIVSYQELANEAASHADSPTIPKLLEEYHKDRPVLLSISQQLSKTIDLEPTVRDIDNKMTHLQQ